MLTFSCISKQQQGCIYMCVLPQKYFDLKFSCPNDGYTILAIFQWGIFGLCCTHPHWHKGQAKNNEAKV